MNKFTKIISVMLAVILVVMAIPFTTFAATKGDVDGSGDVSAVDARLILQYVAELKTEADFKNPAGADVDGNGKITAVDARIILQIVAGLQDAPTEPETPDTPPSDSELGQLIALINAETAKAANGTYKWSRKCEITKDIDVGSSTAVLNNIIKNIDANADLNSVVGSFLGVGNTSGTQADAGKYAIIPMKLTEDDIKTYTRDSEQVNLFIKDSNNPTVGGNTPFNHVSNDFVTEDEVKKSIAEVTTAISVNSCSFNYYSISVLARVDSKGNPESLKISYKMKATMGLKAGMGLQAGVNVNGNGEIETTIEYTNIKY